MHPARAREIIAAGNSSAGNFRKHMTPAEIAEAQAAWDANPSGGSSFYTTLCRFALIEPRKSIDELMAEEPPVPPETPQEEARRKAKRDREKARHIELGWLDKDGNAPEGVPEDEEEEEEEEE